MIEVMPACVIPCCDVWSWGTLTQPKMKAYKAMEAKGKIARLQVCYDRDSRKVVVSYMASLPHQWTRDELRSLAMELQKTEQLKTEVL